MVGIGFYFIGMMLVISAGCIGYSYYRFNKQFNCYCSNNLTYNYDYASGVVKRVCDDCGRKIIVGKFNYEKARAVMPVFECYTGSDMDAQCAFEAMEKRRLIWVRIAKYYEYQYNKRNSYNNLGIREK